MGARRILFAAQKNEGPFIVEWVAYHRIVGFTDIVVVSNDCSDGADTLLDALQDAGAVRHLRQEVPPGTVPQLNAARLAMEGHVFQPDDWVMWLDLDEFLVPKAAGPFLPGLIDRLERDGADAVALHWCVMGDSGQSGLPARFVSPAFCQSSRFGFAPNELVKTLFRFSDRIEALHLHRPIWSATAPPPRVLGGTGTWLDDAFSRSAHRNGDPASRVQLRSGRYTLGQVNHYSVRTRQLFDLKRNRGRGFSAGTGTNTRHTDDFFDRYNANHRDERAILVHEAATSAEMERLLQNDTIRSAHDHCRSHVEFRLAEAAQAARS